MTQAFQHILVPVDFTGKNQRAVALARQLSLQNQARVTLLHVIETLEDLADEEVDDFYSNLESKANAELAALAKTFAEAGLDVTSHVAYGKRTHEIVQYSIDNNIDLIVMSSHKIDLNEPGDRVGTLSHQVSILCQCGVLLVK